MREQNQEKDYQAIWQTCVEMADSISHRRDTMNNLFVTLNIAIVAAISWMWDIKTAFLCLAGLEPWGSTKTSLTVKMAADEVVGWNTNSVIKAIRGW